jgi:hypothetical protein
MEKPRVLVNPAKRGQSETEVLGEGPAVSPAELGSQPTERHRQATLSSVDIMVLSRYSLSDWVLLACDMGVAGTGLLVIRGGFSAFCGASEVDGGCKAGVWLRWGRELDLCDKRLVAGACGVLAHGA